jgi:pimeloyl-ACP methyl ester carboxylesterase
MHMLGIDEPRLVGFARALAASGFFVMTPLVPGIADYRVQAESADLIGTAAQSFAQQLSVSKVGIFAISFSGGLALLAASDPQYSPSIAWIASVGGYYDLAHVLRFFATGAAVRPDGTIEPFSPHEYGSLIVVYDEPGDFFSAHDAPIAHDALKLLLSGNGKASEALTQTMTPGGQQIMQDIYHKHRESLTPAILAEIDKRREGLAAASPAGHLRFLHVPVLLLHGSDDTIIPPTELLWLERDIPKEYLVSAIISPVISHVEVGSKASLRDRLALVHWMAMLIREARSAGGGAAPKLPAGMWIATVERQFG